MISILVDISQNLSATAEEVDVAARMELSEVRKRCARVQGRLIRLGKAVVELRERAASRTPLEIAGVMKQRGGSHPQEPMVL